MFGDEVLKYMADRLRSSTRGGDIVARVGGDEFLIFLEYKKTDLESAVSRIYNRLAGGHYGEFVISVSMGVSMTEAVGTDYDTLFHTADQTLYTVKRDGRGSYRFYDGAMEQALSVVSPIEGEDSQETPCEEDRK